MASGRTSWSANASLRVTCWRSDLDGRLRRVGLGRYRWRTRARQTDLVEVKPAPTTAPVQPAACEGVLLQAPGCVADAPTLRGPNKTLTRTNHCSWSPHSNSAIRPCPRLLPTTGRLGRVILQRLHPVVSAEDASIATRVNSSGTAKNVVRSSGVTPNSNPSRKCVCDAAPARPANIPTAHNKRPCRSTSAKTLDYCAPSAIRMPISSFR